MQIITIKLWHFKSDFWLLFVSLLDVIHVDRQCCEIWNIPKRKRENLDEAAAIFWIHLSSPVAAIIMPMKWTLRLRFRLSCIEFLFLWNPTSINGFCVWIDVFVCVCMCICVCVCPVPFRCTVHTLLMKFPRYSVNKQILRWGITLQVVNITGWRARLIDSPVLAWSFSSTLIYNSIAFSQALTFELCDIFSHR